MKLTTWPWTAIIALALCVFGFHSVALIGEHCREGRTAFAGPDAAQPGGLRHAVNTSLYLRWAWTPWLAALALAVGRRVPPLGPFCRWFVISLLFALVLSLCHILSEATLMLVPLLDNWSG